MMLKVLELLKETIGDSTSWFEIHEVLTQYPTSKGYRVESFISPKFVRITVYKVKENE